jgi:uncharacterized protein YggU (UPF0235/DUF167 family)
VSGRPAANVRFVVRLTPRGGSDRTVAVVDGVLRARVAAPPADGAANRALLRLVARELGVPASRVRLVIGASGREKLVAVAGISPATVQARWPGIRLSPGVI